MGKSLCFTGHRPHKLNGYDPIDNIDLLTELQQTIIYYIEARDVDTFISGMALGIDMWAARIVLKLKETYPHIKLVCAIPCENQWSKWPNNSIAEWNEIVQRADKVHYVSTELYTPWCLQKRNEWMVDNAELVLAVWDETKGGTANCVKYALKRGAEILQLHPHTLLKKIIA